MNKEETIIKYFSGNYAYDLFLMGMIFGNPIYSEYISNILAKTRRNFKKYVLNNEVM